MRKILMGTTAVVGAALLAPAAFAQAPVTTTPGQGGLRGDATGTSAVVAPAPAISAPGGLSIRIGGYFDFRSAYIQDDWDRARSRNSAAANGGGPNAVARNRYDFQNDSELFVFVDGRASNGLTYGAEFQFQMDGVGGTGNTVVDLDEAFMFVGTPTLGRLTFGQEDNAASLMQVRAPGVGELADGNWSDFIIHNGLYGNPYLLAGINDGNDSTKIIYTSPQFAGFDFGLSYAPQSRSEGRRIENTGTLGGAAATFQRDRVTAENEIAVALRYRGTFGPVGVNAGFGAMFADSARQNAAGQSLAPNARAQAINAYTVGLSVAAYGFAVGGEYTWGSYNNAPGGAALNPGLDDSNAFVLGVTYTVGPLILGANYGVAKQDNGTSPAGVALSDRTHTYYGFGVVYNLAPGLALYASYQNINDENLPTAAPSNATYGGTGTTLASFNGTSTRTINFGLAGIRLAF
ncbi:porin [Roseomonas sp. PWR1]|uniref:Porin n=1 Tax=Roseomonas nitratireducens TaxID=2820810 RepID=A0ABS4AZE5_9PROT|nr:porin [Neoroseomonas nitratireducens]MBP0466749.1 porin [Neoroseomonas nitratireducens]